MPFKGEVSSDWLPTLLSWVVPIVIFFVLWNFLFNRMGGGAGAGLMQIGKSKAKVYIEKSTGVTFADVEGIEEAKDELIEVVEFLKHPENISVWAVIFPRASCSSALQAPAKPCWPALSPARRACPSSAFRVPISSRCSLA